MASPQSSLIDQVRIAVEALEAEMAALATATPKVLDGHSDGKRVRYVRMQVRADVLREIVASLTDGSVRS